MKNLAQSIWYDPEQIFHNTSYVLFDMIGRLYFGNEVPDPPASPWRSNVSIDLEETIKQRIRAL